MSTLRSGCYGVVRNIPSVFHSSDLKNFFSDFVEQRKFECFHFKHRPEALRSRDAPSTSTHSEISKRARKGGTCCCIFRATDEDSLSEFIEKYSNCNWIDSKGDYMKERCVIRRIKISGDSLNKNKTAQEVDEDSTKSFSTRGEKRYQKRHAESEDFLESDLLKLSELQPPVQVMPRGNVGTTTKEFMQLIRECKLPPRVIKKLDLKFPISGSTRRYGNVHMQYKDTFAQTVPGSKIYTANGNIITSKESLGSDLGYGESNGAEKYSSQEENKATDDASGSDDDDDTCEEWERHEALHNDVTSQERSKERLFEEEIELKWEKGGSGLVFYTDAQFWQEEEGDFDEQNTDDWDVDMSIYYGEKGDLDAQQYLQMRREKRRYKQIYDDSLGDLKTRKQLTVRSRSESPPVSNKRGKFEKHTKGVGRKLLEKDGWKEGDPLGPQLRPGAITDPIELDSQNPNVKRGLGYHGEKLEHSVKKVFLKSGKASLQSKKFWGPRSREPQASHSPLFPQFAFNLPNNEFKERTRLSRRHAVPGPDDGIVITTAYDEPLNIDTQADLIRSRFPSALKHQPHISDIKDAAPVVNEESLQSPSLNKGEIEKRKDPIGIGRLSSTLCLSSVKFVSGGLLNSKE